MTFAAFIMMFFAQYPTGCLDYTADRFGMEGKICNTTATYRAVGSRPFQCIDGVSVKNEDGSVLMVYQCERKQQLIIHAGVGKPTLQHLDGDVILVDKFQNIVTQAKIAYVETF